jgi:hypothetical protein
MNISESNVVYYANRIKDYQQLTTKDNKLPMVPEQVVITAKQKCNYCSVFACNSKCSSAIVLNNHKLSC